MDEAASAIFRVNTRRNLDGLVVGQDVAAIAGDDDVIIVLFTKDLRQGRDWRQRTKQENDEQRAHEIPPRGLMMDS